MALDYLDPFRTVKFGYTRDSIVDIEIQTSYDGSVNIITTSEDTLPRIVNSRQDFLKDEVLIIKRDNNNLDNVYTNETISKTLLVPSLEGMIPKLVFSGVKEEHGKLKNGGYKYYFRLKTADGIESPIIEESRLVTVHSGTIFGKSVSHIDDTLTSNSVEFTLLDLNDKVYKYVSVYFARVTGQTESVAVVTYKIDRDYEILYNEEDNSYYAQISHTGYEIEIPIDSSEITAEYSPIESVSTLTQKNSRLLLGNIKTSIVEDPILRRAALFCYIEEDVDHKFTVEQKVYNGVDEINDTFANAKAVYYKLGYFPGETYEFAINFVFENGSVSNAYPIMGFDHARAGLVTNSFDYSKLGEDIGWYSPPNPYFTLPPVQNSYGIVRMPEVDIKDAVIWPTSGNPSKIKSYSMYMNTTEMIANMLPALDSLGVSGYFISRRDRIPDLLMEGLITLAGTAPVTSMYPKEATTYTFGMYSGYGLKGDLKDNIVLFPLPGSAMPFSAEGVDVKGNEIRDESAYSFDGITYAPLPDIDENKYFAFYSPDITSDTAKAATLVNRNTYSIYTSSIFNQSIAYNKNTIIKADGDVKYPYSANIHSYTQFYATYYDTTIEKLQYVDDGMRTFASTQFTGRLDRQAAFFLKHPMAAKEYTDGTFLSKTDQQTFSDANFTTYDNGVYKSYDAINGITIKDDKHPYSQLLMTGVKYSPYLGITLKSGSSSFSTHLTGLLSMEDNPTSTSKKVYFTGYKEVDKMVPTDGSTVLGAVVGLYTNKYGDILRQKDWIQKYSVKRSSGYFAISERFVIDNALSKDISWRDAYLTGGDCYTGFYYQRAWRPGGIDGVPAASTPINYVKDGDLEIRNGVNITNSGYAIGFPVRSKYNFAIRSKYKADILDGNLYGKDRTYTSSFPKGEVHGNRQPETSVINYGNIVEGSVNTKQQYDISIPFNKSDYDNRVVTSEISVTGEFENGYRNFKGLNFKDYDEELGEIIAMTSSGVHTYIVYTNGVAIIEVSERSAITSETTGTNVYIGSAGVLPPKSTPVFTTVGSQHLHSVVNTEKGIFGVDADTKKIWSINVTDKKVISEYRIQAILNRLITAELKDIISSYDTVYSEVTFNFIYNDDSQKSILYSVANDLWYGTSDIHKLYQFNIEDVQLSLQKPNDVYGLYYPTINKYHVIDSLKYPRIGVRSIIIDDPAIGGSYDIYNSYIEFILRHEDLSKFNLSNIVINGVGVPTSIDIMSEDTQDYSINPSIFGHIADTIPIHTNIYMKDAEDADVGLVTSSTAIDLYSIRRSHSPKYRDLKREDQITLELETSTNDLIFHQFTIADIKTIAGNDIITLSHKLESNITDVHTLYYGWKVPIRISLGEVASGKTKITIPSKKHADMIKGDFTQDKQGYRNNQANAKPYGRWVRMRLNFNGIDQIYIDSIFTTVTLRYS